MRKWGIDEYKFRISYELPPLREVKTAEFAEFAAVDEEIRLMIMKENPRWRILKIERWIKIPKES